MNENEIFFRRLIFVLDDTGSVFSLGNPTGNPVLKQIPISLKKDEKPISLSVDWLFLKLYLVLESGNAYSIIFCYIGKLKIISLLPKCEW
jgi:hypothetical protein